MIWKRVVAALCSPLLSPLFVRNGAIPTTASRLACSSNTGAGSCEQSSWTRPQLLPGEMIPDDSPIFSLESCPVGVQYAEYIDFVLLPQGLIQHRVGKLVDKIANDHAGQEVHMLCVLKGASMFFADMLNQWILLQERTKLSLAYDFIRAKSYAGTSSSGNVEISGLDTNTMASLHKKHVIIVEDIIDSGLTMARLVAHLNATARPASIKVASFLEKRTGRPSHYRADYVGFSVPDLFVVGYGMDYNEKFRDMRHLAVLNAKGIAAFRS